MNLNLESKISVGYTFHNIDLTEISRQRIRIDEILTELFPKGYSEASFTKNNEETEIIYTIETPLFDNYLSITHFFRSLKILFDDTSDLFPYFCNYKEES